MLHFAEHPDILGTLYALMHDTPAEVARKRAEVEEAQRSARSRTAERQPARYTQRRATACRRS